MDPQLNGGFSAGVLSKMATDLANPTKLQLATLIAQDGSGLLAASRSGAGLIARVEDAANALPATEPAWEAVESAALAGQVELMIRRATGLS